MLLQLLLLFVLFAIAELTLLVKIGGQIGALPTVLLVLGIGMAGAWLARREGFRAVSRIRMDLAEGRLPGDSTIDAVLVLAAGVFMIIPGLLSDVAGLILLIPPTRALLRRWLKSRFESRFTIVQYHADPFQHHSDDLIDVDVHVRDEP